MKLGDSTLARFDFAASHGRPQQPRSKQTRSHAGHSFINYVEQGSGAFAERFNQFQIADRDVIEYQMIGWLEINDVGNVSRGRTLRLVSISKAGARCPNRFGL